MRPQKPLKRFACMENLISETSASLPANPGARRVLFIAYYFPPLGMGGTQRLAKLCKYMQRDGWLPTVVTVKPIAYHAYDESLLGDVKGIRVVRTGSFDPARLLFRWRQLRGITGQIPKHGPKAGKPVSDRLSTWLSWLFVPDTRLLWLPFALWHTVRRLRHEQYFAVVTSGPPHSSHFIGWFVKKIFGGLWKKATHSPARPRIWLADFRDSWSGGDFQPEPTSLHRWFNRALQRFILRRADLVTAISLPLVEELKAIGKPNTVTPHLLPNGYDPEDFVDTPSVAECFAVVFCGAATAVACPQTLIEGFRVFAERAQVAPHEACLRFVGADLTGKIASWVQENNLQRFVEITGYVRHREAIDAMQKAAVLAYVVAPRTSTVYVGGKTYEYLAARRPVLCIGEAVEGLRLLRQYAQTRVCDFYAIDAIALALLAFYAEFKAGELPVAPAIPQEFSRHFQARCLAALLVENADAELDDTPP